MAEEPKTPAPPAPPKRRKRFLIVAVVVLVVLGGIGAGAFWAMRRPAPAAEPAKHAASTEGGIVSFEPFVVNLADQGGTRFLRVSVRLVVETLEEAEKIRKNEVALTRMRAAILDVLTQEKADQLITPEGKSALKAAIGVHIAAVLKGTKVEDVLFSDFVVQF